MVGVVRAKISGIVQRLRCVGKEGVVRQSSRNQLLKVGASVLLKWIISAGVKYDELRTLVALHGRDDVIAVDISFQGIDLISKGLGILQTIAGSIRPAKIRDTVHFQSISCEIE